jgi:phosphoribosylglycinamide formyltransferase-1
MVFVGSDNPDAHGLERAETHGIPCFVVDYTSIIRRYGKTPADVQPPADIDLDAIAAKSRLFPPDSDAAKIRSFMVTRLTAEAMLLENIRSYAFDLIILAGFMRNLTPYFIDRVNVEPDKPRIMNIHPSLLPSFPGTDGYGDTFRFGCKVGGCTVHFVDYGEDTGPIIGQMCFEIKDGDTLESVRTRGLALEWRLYPQCIQLFAQNRLVCVQKTCKGKDGRAYRRTVVRRRPG